MLKKDDINIIKKAEISPNTLKNWVGLQTTNQTNNIKLKFKTSESDKKNINSSKQHNNIKTQKNIKENEEMNPADNKLFSFNNKLDSIVHSLEEKLEKIDKKKPDTFYVETITDKLFYNLSKQKEEIAKISSFLFNDKNKKDKIEKTLETVMTQNELIIEQLAKIETMYNEIILKFNNLDKKEIEKDSEESNESSKSTESEQNSNDTKDKPNTQKKKSS